VLLLTLPVKPVLFPKVICIAFNVTVWYSVILFILCIVRNQFATLNQQNAQYSQPRLYWPRVITDFGYNGSFFHSPAVSLCFMIVTTWVTRVSYISDLRSHRISPTFLNIDFLQLYRFWQNNGNFTKGCSVFKCRVLTRQSCMTTANVI
jgi:hypothetical protein